MLHGKRIKNSWCSFSGLLMLHRNKMGDFLFGIFFLLSFTTFSDSQQVLKPDSIVPWPQGSLTFPSEGYNNYYGNNVTQRMAYLPSHAQKAWFDYNTILPGGTLRKFYFMVHNINADTPLDQDSTFIRLQIWRPTDLTQNQLMLVYEWRVQIQHPNGVASFYTYSVDATTIINGDRIGWMYEGVIGAISFEYTEGYHSYFYSYSFDGSLAPVPAVGQVTRFQTLYLPSVFSIAVSINNIIVMPGYRGATGPARGPGASG